MFSLLGKHFRKTHQLHKLFNRNNGKVSYSSLSYFKSVINAHNKTILNEPEKTSPCNCGDKTSWSLNGSCQCIFFRPCIFFWCYNSRYEANHPHYIGLSEHAFKYWLYIIILSRASQRKTQQSFLFSHEVKTKRRLIWILIVVFYIGPTSLAFLSS